MMKKRTYCFECQEDLYTAPFTYTHPDQNIYCHSCHTMKLEHGLFEEMMLMLKKKDDMIKKLKGQLKEYKKEMEL